jgi:hypothetical protein
MSIETVNGAFTDSVTKVNYMVLVDTDVTELVYLIMC